MYLDACHPAAQEWHEQIRSDDNSSHGTTAATKVMKTIEHNRPGCHLPPAIITFEPWGFQGAGGEGGGGGAGANALGGMRFLNCI